MERYFILMTVAVMVGVTTQRNGPKADLANSPRADRKIISNIPCECSVNYTNALQLYTEPETTAGVARDSNICETVTSKKNIQKIIKNWRGESNMIPCANPQVLFDILRDQAYG